MIIITNIRDVKRKPSIKQITASDGNIYYISLDIIFMYNIKPLMEFENDKWYNMMIESDTRIGLDYALNYISKGNKSIREVKNKLKIRNIDNEAITNVIDRLIELDYLNDIKYAEDYINTYSCCRGKIRLRNELYLKGIDKDIIDRTLKAIDNELENAIEVAKKHSKNLSLEGKERERLIRHLLARGYSYDIIKSVIHHFGGYPDDISDL